MKVLHSYGYVEAGHLLHEVEIYWQMDVPNAE